MKHFRAKHRLQSQLSLIKQEVQLEDIQNVKVLSESNFLIFYKLKN